MKAMIAALMAAGFLAAVSAGPSQAQAPQATEKPAKPGASEKKSGSAKKEKRAPTAGQRAARERQKKCGAEWKAAKAAGTIEKGMRWPQFWSACNKRLRSSGA